MWARIPMKKWSNPHSKQKESKMQYLDTVSKATGLSVCFQGKTLNITVIQVYALTTNAEEAEVEWFYDDLQDLLELIPKKKKSSFHHKGLECKRRESRDTWSKFGKFGLGVQNEAGQRITEFCQENTLVIEHIFFQQHKR